MSDWEAVKSSEIPKTESSSDWEAVPMEANSMQPKSEETIGVSALKAIPRIGEDIYRGGMNALKSIPGYYESAKTSIPNALSTMIDNPKGALKQGIAGLAEAGQNVFNSPHDLANYATNRLNLLPQDINKKIQMGRMPDAEQEINQTFGEPENSGEALIRGTGRNALNLLGASKLYSKFSPTNLKVNNIAKDVVNTGKEMQEKYSGETGKYNKLSEKAEKKGLTGQNIDPSQQDLDILKKDMPQDEYESIDTLMQNKNLTNAQNVISQLGYRDRALKSRYERGEVLTDPEKALWKAVKNTKNNIQENMFKDDSGKVNQSLLNQHKKIQRGYAEEVIPYTKNQMINKFKNRKATAGEMVNSLSHGEFAVKRGKYHPAIAIRNIFSEHPYLSGAGGFAGGKALYNKMFGNNNDPQGNQ